MSVGNQQEEKSQNDKYKRMQYAMETKMTHSAYNLTKDIEDDLERELWYNKIATELFIKNDDFQFRMPKYSDYYKKKPDKNKQKPTDSSVSNHETAEMDNEKTNNFL